MYSNERQVSEQALTLDNSCYYYSMLRRTGTAATSVEGYCCRADGRDERSDACAQSPRTIIVPFARNRLGQVPKLADGLIRVVVMLTNRLDCWSAQSHGVLSEADIRMHQFATSATARMRVPAYVSAILPGQCMRMLRSYCLQIGWLLS